MTRPETAAPEGKTPLFVRCIGCRHRWIAAWLPMPLAKAAEVLKMEHCPSCGGDSRALRVVPIGQEDDETEAA